MLRWAPLNSHDLGISVRYPIPVQAKGLDRCLGANPRSRNRLGDGNLCGAGAAISAFSLATRKSNRGLRRVIAIATALMGGGLIAFSFSRTLWMSLALIAVAAFGMMQSYTASSTVIQTLVDEDKRGRVAGAVWFGLRMPRGESARHSRQHRVEH
jgi:hypothetical protein